MSEELKNKLESLIGGYKINSDDADWLRALSRPAPAVQVPDGYALVPLMSTSNMDLEGAEAANLEGFDRFKAETVYNAMLAASPTLATVAQIKCACGDIYPAASFVCDNCHAANDATLATEAVAQGGGVDVEKVMALVERYGVAKWDYGATRVLERAELADELHAEIRALLASPAPAVPRPCDGKYCGDDDCCDAPAGTVGDGDAYERAIELRKRICKAAGLGILDRRCEDVEAILMEALHG